MAAAAVLVIIATYRRGVLTGVVPDYYYILLIYIMINIEFHIVNIEYYGLSVIQNT